MFLTKKHSDALQHLESTDTKLSDIILATLSVQQGQHTHLSINALNDLATNCHAILDAFRLHMSFAEGIDHWVHSLCAENLLEEVRDLSSKKTGWHTYAKSAKIQQFESFNASQMAITAKTIAPRLWSLIDCLMMSNGRYEVEEDVVDDLAMVDEPVDSDRHNRLHDKVERLNKLRELVSQTNLQNKLNYLP